MKKFDAKLWLGMAVSLFFLVLLCRKIEPDKLWAAFRQMDYRFILPALVLTFLSYFFRALRWKFLLLPLKKTKVSHLFPSTLIGYMANNLLPARLGEFVRAYSLARKEGLETSSVFATLVVDRLWDGFTMLMVLLVTFLFLLKKKPQVVLKVVAFVPVPRVRKKIDELIHSFLDGLQLSTVPHEFSAVLILSVLVWGSAIWPLDLLLRSFGLHFPITVSMFLMVFLVFAVMVPASPGFVGTYHYACVSALSAFDVGREQALSVAIVMHGMGFFPVIAAGLFCLWRDNLSLKKISDQHDSGASA